MSKPRYIPHHWFLADNGEVCTCCGISRRKNRRASNPGQFYYRFSKLAYKPAHRLNCPESPRKRPDLTARNVAILKRVFEDGETQADTAREFGLHTSTIGSMVRRERWKRTRQELHR